MDNQNSNRKISTMDKVGYGIGNFSTGVAMQVVGTYLVFYSTAILGIPGSLVGLAVSISIIWDAVTDPIMGYVSDITHSKVFGRRHLYLIIGAVGIALSNYLIWNISASFSSNIKFMLIFIYIIIFKTSMTIYITPYTALGAELSSDYNERTSIQEMKTIFFLVGLSFVSVAGMYMFFKPTPEFINGQLNPQSYKYMGVVSSFVVLVSSFFCYITTMKYIPILNKHQIKTENIKKFSILISSFKSTFKNVDFKHVSLSYMFVNIASALLSNLCMLVFTYTFGLSSQEIALVLGLQFFVCIISQPVWGFISKKIDKKPSLILGIMISIFSSIIFAVLVIFKDYAEGKTLYFMLYAITAGFGSGGLFTLPLSMVADTIDLDELESCRRIEGTYYGCLTLFYKVAQSFTILLIGFLLDFINFDSSLPVQENRTLITMGIIMALGSSISFLFAWINIKNYSLDKKRVVIIQEIIAERNKIKVQLKK